VRGIWIVFRRENVHEAQSWHMGGMSEEKKWQKYSDRTLMLG
jgi:hypothetical protein